MSKTIIYLIVAIAGMFGVADIFVGDEVAIVVNNIVQIIGILGAWYGRVVATDRISWLGLK